MFRRHNDEYVVDVDQKNATGDLNPRVTISDNSISEVEILRCGLETHHQRSVVEASTRRQDEDRLQSLKSRYEYHTAVEETCLNKFGEFSSRALESAQSAESITHTNKMPTPIQVIDFALLDEWALWLDEKAPVIEQCSRSCSNDDRRAIID